MQDSFKSLIKELKTFFAPENIYFNPDGQFVKFRMVVTAEKLAPLTALLDSFFKAPFKPAGEKPARELANLEIIQALNGIRREQTLYLNTSDTEVTYFAAIWPWQSDPDQASLFSGIFYPGAETDQTKEAMTKAKTELEQLIKE